MSRDVVRYQVRRHEEPISPACQLPHISPERRKIRVQDLRGKGGTVSRERKSNLTMRITSAGWLQTALHVPPVAPCASGGKKSKITELSYDSLERLRFIAAHTPVDFRSMVTLTYPAEYPMDAARIKRDLDAFLKALKRKTNGPCEYLWVLEFQRRGAPHFHVWLSHAMGKNLVELKRPAPKKPALVSPSHQKWVSETWFRIVDSGDAKHLRAGACWEAVRDVDGARKYLTKECSKKWQKKLPEGWDGAGRWWGTSRGVREGIPRPVSLSADEVGKMLAILPPDCLNPHTGRPFNNIWTPPNLT